MTSDGFTWVSILLSNVIPDFGRMQSVDEMFALLRTAGTRKQPVAAMYAGHPRLFCPHLLGRSKQGRRHALCYQFGGTSDSGLRIVVDGVGGWRCIEVEKLSGVELQSGTWNTEPRSNQQTCIEEVEFDADAQQGGDDPQ
jgi:hypothetical protein